MDSKDEIPTIVVNYYYSILPDRLLDLEAIVKAGTALKTFGYAEVSSVDGPLVL